MEEIWRVIKLNDEDTKYFASNMGRIKNSDTGKIKKFTKNSKGYLNVTMYHNCVKYTKSVHQVIYNSFYTTILSNVNDGINHKDGNKENNKMSNLEFCSHKYNMKHASSTGLIRHGETHPKIKYSNKTIHTICKMLECGHSVKEVSDALGVKTRYVSMLRDKEIRLDIVSDYEFPELQKHSNIVDSATKRSIKKLANDGYNVYEIMNSLDLENTKKIYNLIYQLKRQIDKRSTTIPRC